MEEYRIDMKVRNNLILAKIEEKGHTSAHSFCKDTGICYTKLISFLNMKETIFDNEGQVKRFVLKLCKELNCIPEELFSASQMEASLKSNKRTLKTNEAEMKFMLQQNNNQKLLEDHYYNEQLVDKIEEVLSKSLTQREEKIVKMRMGLGEYDREHSLDEIAKIQNISRERIRQIEAKALRKLRHPSRAGHLREFIKT